MPLPPIPPVPVDENVPVNYPTGAVQPGASQIVVDDTQVLITPPFTQNPEAALFQEQLIFELQNQKIQIAQLQADNSYLRGQLNEMANKQPEFQETILEGLYFK